MNVPLERKSLLRRESNNTFRIISFISIILLILAAFCVLYLTPTPIISRYFCGETTYDHVMLVIASRCALCLNNICRKTTDEVRWIIHSFIPTNTFSSDPLRCCIAYKFDFNEVGQLESRLKEFWPSLFNFLDNKELWKLNWENHGTCINDTRIINAQLEYFSNALNIFLQYPIANYLKKKFILPTPIETIKTNYPPMFSTNIFRNAIESQYGKKIQLYCILHPMFSVNDSFPIITYVKLCFDTKLIPIDCPLIKDNCKTFYDNKNVLFYC